MSYPTYSVSGFNIDEDPLDPKNVPYHHYIVTDTKNVVLKVHDKLYVSLSKTVEFNPHWHDGWGKPKRVLKRNESLTIRFDGFTNLD